MKTKFLAVTLAAVAVVAAIILLKPSEPEKSPTPATEIQSRKSRPRMAPAPDSESSAPERRRSAQPADPDTAEGLAEIDEFLKNYRKAADSDEKIDLLADVRKLDLEDRPAINDFLLNEIFDSDEEVRDSARTALVEYGGENAHRALAALLEARPDAPEIDELKKVLDMLQMPPYSPPDKRSATHPGGDSPPSRLQPATKQPNQ